MGKETEKAEKPKGEEGMITRKLLETRTVLLSGEIDKESAEKTIRQLLVLEANDRERPIRIFIDSPGGDADAGYAIFDMVRFIEPTVYTIGMGLVASAGAIVLLAAPSERRLALPNSHYMIHQPHSGIRGVVTEIEIHAQELEKLRLKSNKLIAEETGVPVEKVNRDTDRDFWMDAEEALAYGLVNHIIQTRTEMNAL